jgi:hypothetical protein
VSLGRSGAGPIQFGSSLLDVVPYLKRRDGSCMRTNLILVVKSRATAFNVNLASESRDVYVENSCRRGHSRRATCTAMDINPQPAS